MATLLTVAEAVLIIFCGPCVALVLFYFDRWLTK